MADQSLKMVPVPGTTGALATRKLSGPSPGNAKRLPVIFGHGLGRTMDVPTRYTKGIIDERLTIVYDSRGHGESSGWEGSSPEVFTWEAMQNDVFTIADAYGLESFVIGGDSMTTAASVYTAMQGDPRIKGYVMCRAPTAWATREARREQLTAKAGEKKEGLKKNVLLGSAVSNLPPQDAIKASKASDAHPALLLSIAGDPVHPVETAEALHAILPGSELHVFDDEAARYAEFPRLICEFLQMLDEIHDTKT